MHFSSSVALLSFLCLAVVHFVTLLPRFHMSAAAVDQGGFIDTYAALPVERFDEAADDSKRQHGGNSSASAAPIVSAHNLHKTYLLGVEGVPALRGVNLNIAAGEFIMILGTSGGGKVSAHCLQLLHCRSLQISLVLRCTRQSLASTDSACCVLQCLLCC